MSTIVVIGEGLPTEVEDQEDIIEVEIFIEIDATLDYKLGKHLYRSYLRHYVENNIDNKTIRVSIDYKRRRQIPLSFLSGLTDELVASGVSRDRVIFKTKE